MADTYATVAGFIQFPVEERELDSGQTVRDATVRSIATGDLIRITFWPDFEDAEIAEGDFIAVDGKVSTREADGRTYVNMSARTVFIGVPVEPKEREVATKAASKPKSRKAF